MSMPSMSPWFIRSLASFILAVWVVAATSPSIQAAESEPVVATSLQQLARNVGQGRRVPCSFRLEATVCTADPASHVLFLADDSQTVMFEFDWGNIPLQSGQRILLQATNCAVGWDDGALKIGDMPVVDVDGSHPSARGSGKIYLHTGKVPLRIQWFNDVSGAILDVQYDGPDLSRRKIPDSVLFLPARNGTNRENGVAYRCFEGGWGRLPDFQKMEPLKTGVAANFDIGVRTRPEHAGVEFTSLLAVPADGWYTFYVNSDDGGQLFMPDVLPQITVEDSAPLPTPKLVVVGEALSTNTDSQWAEAEGELSFMGKKSGRPELELGLGDSHMRLKLANFTRGLPDYLLHSRVEVIGICLGTFSADGNKLANSMLVPDWQHIRVIDVPSEAWSKFPEKSLDDLEPTNPFAAAAIRVYGSIKHAPAGGRAFVQAGDVQIPVEMLMPLPESDGGQWEVLGNLERDGTNLVLRQAIYRNQTGSDAGPGPKTTLTTAAQVQRLTRDQARRSYRVKLKGVVTFVTPNIASMVLQDATRAIFATHYSSAWTNGVPQVGDYWEIEGVSRPADFSPVVEVRRATRLGSGRLPDPVQPTWDQLINGSLDAQYVELQGIVTAVESNSVSLYTRMGKIDVALMEFPPDRLKPFKNALVSIRGCLFAEWDRDTHRVKVQSGIQIGNPSVVMDEPPPLNPFDAGVKSAAELLYFDPQASAFQRVKVLGQVLCANGNTFFMTDGTNGVRFVPKEFFMARPGDLVEVVGFPELGGPSPVLREAVARITGSAPLPEPRSLPARHLADNDYDATRVHVNGVLVSVRQESFQQMLEMQSGLRTFAARVFSTPAAVSDLKIGSRLELTGVYAGLGGGRTEGHDTSAFELLLPSPDGIRVLAQPPWWTLRRLFVLTGVLIGVIVLAVIWINVLRQQVGRRTVQLSTANKSLEAEITERKRAENELVQARLQHLLEQERTRIARDIHDELGSSLSQIRLLSEMTMAQNGAPPAIQTNSGKISAKALEATHVLDEIVWAVDPQNDTLESLVSYLFNYASEYLSLAGIRFRIDAPTQIPHHVLTTQVRHQLYMAVKETLTNIVNHAQAAEVWIRLQLADGTVSFVVEDNGRGFDPSDNTGGVPGASGLNNMRKRFNEIGGDCTVESAPHQGTRIKFVLPLSKKGIV